jgi:hypothetical protein
MDDRRSKLVEAVQYHENHIKGLLAEIAEIDEIEALEAIIKNQQARLDKLKKLYADQKDPKKISEINATLSRPATVSDQKDKFAFLPKHVHCQGNPIEVLISPVRKGKLWTDYCPIISEPTQESVTTELHQMLKQLSDSNLEGVPKTAIKRVYLTGEDLYAWAQDAEKARYIRVSCYTD